MSKTLQRKKNITLSEKLSQYLSDHPSVANTLPDDASFVVFSSVDKQLNLANEKLIKSLSKTGKHIVKALKTESSNSPWQFTQV